MSARSAGRFQQACADRGVDSRSAFPAACLSERVCVVEAIGGRIDESRLELMLRSYYSGVKNLRAASQRVEWRESRVETGLNTSILLSIFYFLLSNLRAGLAWAFDGVHVSQAVYFTDRKLMTDYHRRGFSSWARHSLPAAVRGVA
jgi:hypothetical protein